MDKFYAHENYNRPRFANDVAVIRVKETIEFNDRVQPIEPSNVQINDGDEVLLTGWGRLRVSLGSFQFTVLIVYKTMASISN